MIRYIRTLFATLAVGTILVASVGPSVGAIELFPEPCKGNNDTAVCKGKDDTVNSFVKDITKILLWAIGVVAVIMLLYGGFKYVTSNGDSNNIHAAKNTILYAIIGLMVAILGQVIVTFVVGWL